MHILDTDRLSIDQFTESDTGFIIRLLNSEGWLRFIGNRNITNPVEALAYLEKVQFNSYKTTGYGFWKVSLKKTGEPMGMCGVFKRDSLPAPDIGFAFLPEYHGSGYAFEAANACLDYVKKQYSIPEITAICSKDNEKSITLLEKLGLKYVSPFILPGEIEELSLFSAKLNT